MNIVHDKLVNFHENAEGVHVEHLQEIPAEHMTALRLEKADSLSTPAGEMYRVASIPVAVIEEWLREDPPFNIDDAPIREILKRLHKQELDGFICTNKRI